MGGAVPRGFTFKKAIARCIFTVSRLACLGIAKLAFRLHIEGQEHIPITGSAILAANHVSYIDPIILAIAVRRPICFMAKKELFRFLPFGWLLRQFGAFPVNRHRINMQAFKRAISLLEAGELVAIFPEGTRGDGVALRPGKPGVGLIAARSGAPVIPIFHQGTEKVLPRGAWLPRPHRITVKFGAPCRLVMDQAGERQDQVAAVFGQTIMEKIAVLKSGSGSTARAEDDHTCTGDTEIRASSQRSMNEDRKVNYLIERRN